MGDPNRLGSAPDPTEIACDPLAGLGKPLPDNTLHSSWHSKTWFYHYTTVYNCKQHYK